MAKTVLAVDDFGSSLDTYRNVLSPKYELKVAHNGEEALRIIEGNEPIDLLIVAYNLRGNISHELLMRKVVEKNNDAKLILAASVGLSTDPQSVDRVIKELKRLGLDAKPLKKPINSDDLSSLVDSLVGE